MAHATIAPATFGGEGDAAARENEHLAVHWHGLLPGSDERGVLHALTGATVRRGGGALGRAPARTGGRDPVTNGEDGEDVEGRPTWMASVSGLVRGRGGRRLRKDRLRWRFPAGLQLVSRGFNCYALRVLLPPKVYSSSADSRDKSSQP